MGAIGNASGLNGQPLFVGGLYSVKWVDISGRGVELVVRSLPPNSTVRLDVELCFVAGCVDPVISGGVFVDWVYYTRGQSISIRLGGGGAEWSAHNLLGWWGSHCREGHTSPASSTIHAVCI